MSDQPVTLHIPRAIFERVRRIAEDDNRPVESVLLDMVASSVVTDEEEEKYETLTEEKILAMSNDELWQFAERPLPTRVTNRFSQLNETAGQRDLTPQEKAEQEQLGVRWDRCVYIRSLLLVTLKQRGEDVDTFLSFNK